MTKNQSALPLALLLCLPLACGPSGPSGEAEASSTSEAVTVPLTINVAELSYAPSTTTASRLSESSHSPTPSLTAVTISPGAASFSGTYNTTTKTASVSMTNAQISAMTPNFLEAGTEGATLSFSYDSTTSNPHPLTYTGSGSWGAHTVSPSPVYFDSVPGTTVSGTATDVVLPAYDTAGVVSYVEFRKSTVNTWRGSFYIPTQYATFDLTAAEWSAFLSAVNTPSPGFMRVNFTFDWNDSDPDGSLVAAPATFHVCTSPTSCT